MLDLYAILGVRKGCRASTLKKAFRKASMATHPHRTPGDSTAPDKFGKVKLAYEILSDPAKRAHYDATGDYSAKVPDNADSGAIGVLSNVLGVVLTGLIDGGQDPVKHDLQTIMRQTLEKGITALEGNRTKLRKHKKTLEAIVGRFTTDGENFLDSMVRAQLAACGLQEGTMEAHIVQHKRAMDILKKFRFRAEMQQVMSAMWQTASATTSGMFFQGFR